MLECAFIAVKITERIGIRQERNAATMQCRRFKCGVAIATKRSGSGLFRHDVIQKKHSIIQRSIKSPPEHCIPTVERLYSLYLFSSFDRLNRKQHRLQIFTVKVYLPLVILPFGTSYFNSYIALERIEQVFQ